MPEPSAAHPEPGHVPPAGEPGHFPWKIVLTILLIAGIVAFALIRRKGAGASQANLLLAL